MTFEEVWQLPINTLIRVRDGTPPGTLQEGVVFNAWKSNNFTGLIEEKITEEIGGETWRSITFEIPTEDTPDFVEYLSYTIAEGGAHRFEEI